MSHLPHRKQFKLNMNYLDHTEYFTQKAMVQRVITNRVDLQLPERRVWAHLMIRNIHDVLLKFLFSLMILGLFLFL